jgi:pimeloyl-ACP methyl ester carboxylesterase
VAALALLDTNAEAEPLANKVKYRLLIAFSRRLGLPRALFDREVAPLFFAPATIRDRPELVDDFARTAGGFDRDGFARAAIAVVVHRRSIADKISAIKAPTLVICGREDRATPPEKSEQIAQSIPGAKLVWIEGAGHMSALEKPDAVNAALVPFVREQLG